jgi:hypothetical protein
MTSNSSEVDSKGHRIWPSSITLFRQKIDNTSRSHGSEYYGFGLVGCGGVQYVGTYVSDKPVASIFRIELM